MKTKLLPTTVRGGLEAPPHPPPSYPPSFHSSAPVAVLRPYFTRFPQACSFASHPAFLSTYSRLPTHPGGITRPYASVYGSPRACLIQSVEAPPFYHRMSQTRRRRVSKRGPVEDPAPAGGGDVLDVDALAGVCDPPSSRPSGEAPPAIHNGRSTRRLSCCVY